MYRFNQHSFVGGQLDRGLMGRQDLERYFQGASKLENFIVRKQGNITKRRGTEMIADLSDVFNNGAKVAYSRLIPFSYEITGGYYALFLVSKSANKKLLIIGEGGIVTEMEHDYEGVELGSIGYTQSGDVLFIVHKNHPPRKLTRLKSQSSPDGEWRFEDINFLNNQTGRPTITSLTGSGFNGNGATASVSYVITSVSNGVESAPSEPKKFSYKLPWPENATVTLKCSQGTAPTPNYYNIYKASGGEYGLIISTKGREAVEGGAQKEPTIDPETGEESGSQNIPAATINEVVDDYITPNLAFSPPVLVERFKTAGNYPSSVAIYTQRLAFAATERSPFTWWMSCVGDLYNFGTHATLRQDDAMEVSIPATEFPNINHMILDRELIMLCDNGEWMVKPSSGNTLAYDTVECKRQSSIGCAKEIAPIQVGDEIIFADNSRRVVRSIKYQFASDGYESNDLSILSQSLFFSNPVVSMCYKQHPESLVLCELADGSIAALVYMKEHNVVAWTHHTLGGGWKCRGIASNKAHEEETTHVAMLVEHPDGSTEVWRIRDDSESADLADQLCMDGLRFARGSRIGAAAFENGQAVIDLENGQRVNSAAGLEDEKEYAVGYPFASTFVSVRPEPQGAETFQWELKNAKKVHIRTLNGSPFIVKDAGMSDEYASPVNIDRGVTDGEITTPGLIDATDILLNGENSRDGRIEIKHDGILPLTIESFSVDYETQPLYGSEG